MPVEYWFFMDSRRKWVGQAHLCLMYDAGIDVVLQADRLLVLCQVLRVWLCKGLQEPLGEMVHSVSETV